MLLNCDSCYRCCTHFTKDTMAPFVQEDEKKLIGHENFHQVEFPEIGETMTLMKRKNDRCIAWSYEEHCTIYPARPADCMIYPFTVKNGDMIVHLTCPDSVRLLNLVDAGDINAGRLYTIAKSVILNASEKYLTYLEYQTRNLKFYCVVT